MCLQLYVLNAERIGLKMLLHTSDAGIKDGALVDFFFEIAATPGLFLGRLVNDTAGDWYRGGRAVARGVYFIKVVAPGINEIRKVLVVK